MSTFDIRREGNLTVQDHEDITRMLALSFPSYATGFHGTASWSGMQPETRITASDGAGIAAHAGVKRLFVQTGDSSFANDQLVGAVGMVSVRPDLQGTGLGGALAAAIRGVLDDMAVPFGLLETGAETSGYYERHGWHPLPGTVGSYNGFAIEEPARVVRGHTGWLVLPVASPLEDWPQGDIRWNGQMV
ncbi:GNAT family protein [Planctomonas psychrotolerans]|uniref:GNAT family N-acetyltransferase n=1 Tax=Planctomonas psychrotolerans TaxID=2528712 RepID=UPI0012396E27|nr:GNAT family N-acetyltransferase [Planctomonas psychrotolerans]